MKNTETKSSLLFLLLLVVVWLLLLLLLLLLCVLACVFNLLFLKMAGLVGEAEEERKKPLPDTNCITWNDLPLPLRKRNKIYMYQRFTV